MLAGTHVIEEQRKHAREIFYREYARFATQHAEWDRREGAGRSRQGAGGGCQAAPPEPAMVCVCARALCSAAVPWMR